MALVIYVKPNCPYCQKARDHYTEQGVEWTEYDAQSDRERRAEMLRYSDGDPTVPCIVENGEYISSGWGTPPRG
ncbi:MAG: glutathione S-transferase N-terminal domain-containing protein [Pyrinomonadaceae bacterium]|jgi:glutaredoxin|nr:glutathione S-transferase N-terminal domain-containing protein [Pyrinomonadaceae bacterium]